MSYMPPEQVHVCRCQSTGAPAIFCPTGHMLECHYPLDCRQAACGHMPKYEDLDPDEMAEMEQGAENLLKDIAAQDCETCEGKGRTQVSATIRFDNGEFPFTGWAICPCVPRALEFHQEQPPTC